MINLPPFALKSILKDAAPLETVRVIRFLGKWGIQASMEVQALTYNPIAGDLVTFRSVHYKVGDKYDNGR